MSKVIKAAEKTVVNELDVMGVSGLVSGGYAVCEAFSSGLCSAGMVCQSGVGFFLMGFVLGCVVLHMVSSGKKK